MNGPAVLVAAYESVRAMAYDTAAAYDAVGLRTAGRGNCVAKASLLAEELATLGATTRLTSWEYELPVLVDVQHELGFRTDVHTPVQALVDGGWVLVDATHDPPLAALGLTVGRWDGRTSTEPAYPPLGPVVAHDAPDAAARLEALTSRIGRQVEGTPVELVDQYRRDLNDLMEQARR